MPTTEDGKKVGAARRAELNESDNNFTSQDTFGNPALATLTNTQTVEDGFGIERIISPSTDAYTPAPLSATPEQIEAAEKFQTTLDDAKKTRTEMFKQGPEALSDVDEEDRAANVQGMGGTQVLGEPAKNDQSTSLGGNPAERAQAASNEKKEEGK